MGFEFTWDILYKGNPHFSWATGTYDTVGIFYKISDTIISKKDLIGQSISYWHRSYQTPFECVEIIEESQISHKTFDDSTIMICHLSEPGCSWAIISGPAGRYRTYEHPFPIMDGYTTIPEDGTYVRYGGEELAIFHDIRINWIGKNRHLLYGWIYYDGFFDDQDQYLQSQNGLKEFIKDSSVTGAWRCKTIEFEAVSFKWYKEDVLISEQSGGEYSDLVPSVDKVGQFWYRCEATAADGTIFKTGSMIAVVKGDDSSNPGDGGSGGDGTDNYVTDISLTVNPDTVPPGGHALFAVDVNGIGNYDPSFTAQINGHTSANTKLSQALIGGNLLVGTDETADYVLLTVASVQAPDITATEMIYIDHSGTGDGIGITEEQLRLAFWKGYAAAKAMKWRDLDG